MTVVINPQRITYFSYSVQHSKMKYTVYLSTSKSGNYDKFLMIKSRLANDLECDIVTFKGGTYSPEPMYECSILFVVPPKMKDGKMFLGKGQFDTVRLWKNKKGNRNVWFVSDIDSMSIDFMKVNDAEVIDKNWQNSFATYEMTTETAQIKDRKGFEYFLTNYNEGIDEPETADLFNYDIIL